MYKMKIGKKLKNLIIGIIFILILLFSLYWASQKEGYFVDELYTYGLSNSYMKPFLDAEEGYLNYYHSGEEFFDYLTVSEEDDFAFDSVWYNQAKDVHPPFYYVIIHLVSSIFKETMSPWIGVGVNYFFYILSLFLFYYIAKDLCQNKWNAVIASIFFAISAGTINCLVFIRMYMMLMFWILLYTWLMIQFFRNNIERKTELFHYIALYSVIVCGFLTHYHFIIPAVVLSLVYILYLLIHKRIKNIFYYLISCVAAAVTTQYIFEASFNHIFVGYRGVEAIHNAKYANLFERILVMWNYVDKHIYGGCFIFIALLLLCCCVLAWIKTKKRKTVKKVSNVDELYKRKVLIWIQMALAFTTVVSFVIICKTAAFLEARYLFMLYPFIVLIVFIIIDWIAKCYNGKIKYIIIVTTCLICTALSYGLQEEPTYLFTDNATVPKIILENYQGTNAVYVTDLSYRYVSDSYVLSMHKDIYVVGHDAIDHMLWFEEDDEVILYLNHWILDSANVEDVKTVEYYLELAENAGYSSCEYLGNTEHSQVYALNK